MVGTIRGVAEEAAPEEDRADHRDVGQVGASVVGVVQDDLVPLPERPWVLLTQDVDRDGHRLATDGSDDELTETVQRHLEAALIVLERDGPRLARRFDRHLKDLLHSLLLARRADSACLPLPRHIIRSHGKGSQKRFRRARMKAAVLYARQRPLSVEEIDLDPPKAGEVRVRIKACGGCHTDLSVIVGSLPLPLPIVLGHEGAGVIEEVGPEVVNLAPGDHVVLSWRPSLQPGQ